jgi:hypothetical protein
VQSESVNLMSIGEREQVRRLTQRLKGLLREAGGSQFMTREQRAKLLSITKILGPIFDKYGTLRG